MYGILIGMFVGNNSVALSSNILFKRRGKNNFLHLAFALLIGTKNKLRNLMDVKSLVASSLLVS